MTYKEHYKRWMNARKLVYKHNDELIKKWRAIPWYQSWKKPSFEEQRQIILDNWREFERLPKPRLEEYFPINLRLTQ